MDTIFSEKHYKETTPEETVQKLLGILDRLGLETDEQWGEESYVGTYWMRVTFKGTNMGTNGKGVTKAFTRASAYAELFERYQNNFLSLRNSRMAKAKYGFYEDRDEKLLTAEELVEQGGAFIENYFRLLGMQDRGKAEKVEKLLSIEKMEQLQFGRGDDAYTCLPFYSVRDRRIYYLPYTIYARMYGSNGMAAGNSPEEAIVQGLSEIIERVAQRRIFMEAPCLPDIPEDYVARYPYIYERYKKMKARSDYYFSLKDCSFGGKYPVAGLFISEKNSGQYGVKLGCHPYYGIAMERAFTEASQGDDILVFSKRSRLDFYNTYADKDKNIANSFKIGMGVYPYQIFGSEPDYAFTPARDVSGLSNREILRLWADEIIKGGDDILIRDFSSLGFPTYHIIIPGQTEMYPQRLNTDGAMERRIRAHNTKVYCVRMLTDLSSINLENVKYLISSLQYDSGAVLENTLDTYVPGTTGWPYSAIHCDFFFLLAMCYYYLGEYKDALRYIKKIKEVARRDSNKLQREELVMLDALGFYISLRDISKPHEAAVQILSTFYSEDVTAKLDDWFSVKGEHFSRIFGQAVYAGDSLRYAQEQASITAKVISRLYEARRDSGIDQNHIDALFYD